MPTYVGKMKLTWIIKLQICFPSYCIYPVTLLVLLMSAFFEEIFKSSLIPLGYTRDFIFGPQINIDRRNFTCDFDCWRHHHSSNNNENDGTRRHVTASYQNHVFQGFRRFRYFRLIYRAILRGYIDKRGGRLFRGSSVRCLHSWCGWERINSIARIFINVLSETGMASYITGLLTVQTGGLTGGELRTVRPDWQIWE